MTQLLLRCNATAMCGPCGLCTQPTTAPPGTQLVTADGQPVCPDCGKRHAPSLAALAQLASEAERVGKIGRHTVFPPYTALLDLASATHWGPLIDLGVRRLMRTGLSWVAFTPVFNMTGQPAMSVPLYWTASGLPIGTQLAAGWGNDGILFQVATQLERLQPWFGRRPPRVSS